MLLLETSLSWKNKYAWNSTTKGIAVVNEVVCDFVFIVKFVVAFFFSIPCCKESKFARCFIIALRSQ